MKEPPPARAPPTGSIVLSLQDGLGKKIATYVYEVRENCAHGLCSKTLVAFLSYKRGASFFPCETPLLRSSIPHPERDLLLRKNQS